MFMNIHFKLKRHSYDSPTVFKFFSKILADIFALPSFLEWRLFRFFLLERSLCWPFCFVREPELGSEVFMERCASVRVLTNRVKRIHRGGLAFFEALWLEAFQKQFFATCASFCQNAELEKAGVELTPNFLLG